jgi:MoxR-like ATPase
MPGQRVGAAEAARKAENTSGSGLEQQRRIVAAAAHAQAIISNIENVVVGKRQTIEYALAAALAGGHILLEDVPGLGKTMLARALSVSIGLEFRRIQFTADLMPSDIVGGPVYNPKDGSFSLRLGPVFANIVLADEINRANPRAQSALLECMEEGQITLDRQTVRLPAPFMVVATQNPIDMAGTYPLPEAQLDRFLVRLSLGYPEPKVEAAFIDAQQFAHPISALQPACDATQFAALADAARHVTMSPELQHFATAIVNATRKSSLVRHGASPRGTLGLARMARALSCIRGVAYVDPAVVRELAVPVLAHRMVLQPQVAAQRSAASVVQELLAAQATPR